MNGLDVCYVKCFQSVTRGCLAWRQCACWLISAKGKPYWPAHLLFHMERLQQLSRCPPHPVCNYMFSTQGSFPETHGLQARYVTLHYSRLVSPLLSSFGKCLELCCKYSDWVKPQALWQCSQVCFLGTTLFSRPAFYQCPFQSSQDDRSDGLLKSKSWLGFNMSTHNKIKRTHYVQLPTKTSKTQFQFGLSARFRASPFQQKC